MTLKEWIEKIKEEAEASGCSEFKAIAEVLEASDSVGNASDILQEFMNTAKTIQDELNSQAIEEICECGRKPHDCTFEDGFCDDHQDV